MSKTTRQRGKAVARPATRRSQRKSKSTPSAAQDAEKQAGTRPMPVAAKGKRAKFHRDPAVDSLLAVIAALTAEVSVAFDRIATLERLLEQRDVLDADAIDSYCADEAENLRRSQARDALIDRVFRVLRLQEPSSDD